LVVLVIDKYWYSIPISAVETYCFEVSDQEGQFLETNLAGIVIQWDLVKDVGQVFPDI
jgi:hypothetical protein